MPAVAEVEGELKILNEINPQVLILKTILLTLRGIETSIEKLPIKCGGKASSGLQKGHSYVSSAHFSASASF